MQDWQRKKKNEKCILGKTIFRKNKKSLQNQLDILKTKTKYCIHDLMNGAWEAQKRQMLIKRSFWNGQKQMENEVAEIKKAIFQKIHKVENDYRRYKMKQP